METMQYLAAAEKTFRQKLENFISLVFRESFLPSHGPGHHARVWQYALELAATGKFSLSDEISAAKLIMACYLHDSGMAIERGERHGKESMELCRVFLSQNGLNPDEYADLLEAIENHDNKNYQVTGNPSPLKLILNIADDLDAFGFTGIYRYIEIYTERNIPLRSLGEKIKSNAASRFENFRKHFFRYSDLFRRHSERYRVLEDYCMNYIIQSAEYSFGTGSPAGYCGIAEIISEMLRQNIDPCTGMEQYITERSYNDPVILWFSGNLRKELSGAT